MGNTIGLTANMTAKLPNAASGVSLLAGASENVVGGSSPASGNIISGNGYGVYLANPDTLANQILGNAIGTNRSDAGGLGNQYHGIAIYDSSANQIGQPGAPNVISGNLQLGIDLAEPAQSEI